MDEPVFKVHSVEVESLADLENRIRASVTNVIGLMERDSTVVNGDYICQGVTNRGPLHAFIPKSIVIFSGIFTPASARSFIDNFVPACAAACNKSEDNRVTIVLNSDGGDVNSLLDIVDCLKVQKVLHPKLLIDILAVKSICSCGFLLFMNGDRLYVTHGTRFLHHQPFHIGSDNTMVSPMSCDLDSASLHKIKNLTYAIAEDGFFARRIRHKDGFLLRQPDEDPITYRDFRAVLEQCTNEINQSTSELQHLENVRSETISFEYSEEDQMAHQMSYKMLEKDIDEYKITIRDNLRARWFETHRVILAEMFPGHRPPPVSFDSKLIFENKVEAVAKLNVFRIVTETYADNPTDCFLNHAEMVRLGFLTGSERFTHIYNFTTQTTIHVLIHDDTLANLT
jgi:hypothetical protein